MRIRIALSLCAAALALSPQQSFAFYDEWGSLLGQLIGGGGGTEETPPPPPPPESCTETPNLSHKEMVALALMEQLLSVQAAVLDGAECTAATYTFDLSVNPDASGSATLDDLTVVVSAANVVDLDSGVQVTVDTSSGPGMVDDTPVANLLGNFWYSAGGELLSGESAFDVGESPASPYQERITKSLCASSIAVENDGLESIKMEDVPRANWSQEGKYMLPIGVDVGGLSATKIRVAPMGAKCEIDLDAWLDNYGSGIQAQGTVKVGPAPD